MKQLGVLIQKATHAKTYLWLLNRVMNHAVRFNKPHGFQVVRITQEYVETFAPYHKKNWNHVRGIHACAIATVGELSAGLMLMYHFSPTDYRIILSQIHIDYHYQAKKNIISKAAVTVDEKNKMLESLNTQPKTLCTVISEIRDDDAKHIATVQTQWQIKKWVDVKTPV